MGKHTLTKHAA